MLAYGNKQMLTNNKFDTYTIITGLVMRHLYLGMGLQLGVFEFFLRQFIHQVHVLRSD